METSINHQDFDLLAGHDFGDADAFPKQTEEDPDALDVLVWHKLDTVGYQPSAREGHTSATNGLSVIVFGGFEAGKRCNSAIMLDVMNQHWSTIEASGDIPPARAYHTAVVHDNMMIIHGGEGVPLMADGSNGSVMENVASASSDENDQQQKQKQTLKSSKTDQRATLRSKPTAHTLGDNSLFSVDKAELEHGSDMVPNNYSVKGPMREVTLGDTLTGSTLAPGPKVIEEGEIHCLDDIYVLDLLFMEWFKIDSILSPLPRKGHTMSIANLHGEPHVIIFGGHSMEKLTLSNSVHACPLSEIRRFYQQKQEFINEQRVQAERRRRSSKSSSSSSSSNNNNKGNNNNSNKSRSLAVDKITSLRKDASNNPIVWRTLDCMGKPPSARYKHSATVIAKDGFAPLLVVIGGIGTDPSVALSDVFILNLETLTWTSPLYGSNALELGKSGEGPSSGIFGHVAFPVMAPPKPSAVSQQSNSIISHRRNDGTTGAAAGTAAGTAAIANNDIDFGTIPSVVTEETPSVQTSSSGVDVLVFGGNTDPIVGAGSSNAIIHALNLDKHWWRKVKNGYQFPSARSSHTVSVVQGWAPSNTVPSKQSAAAADTSAAKIDTPAATDHNYDNTTTAVGRNGGKKPHTTTATTTAATTTAAAAGGVDATMSSSAAAPAKVCAVLFGGMNSTIRCASDTWALDLQWRSAGVNQYDSSVPQQEQRALRVVLDQSNRDKHTGNMHRGPESGTTTAAANCNNNSASINNTATGGKGSTPMEDFRSTGLSYPMFDNAADAVEYPDRSLAKLQSLRSQQYLHAAATGNMHATAKELRRMGADYEQSIGQGTLGYEQLQLPQQQQHLRHSSSHQNLDNSRRKATSSARATHKARHQHHTHNHNHDNHHHQQHHQQHPQQQLTLTEGSTPSYQHATPDHHHHHHNHHNHHHHDQHDQHSATANRQLLHHLPRSHPQSSSYSSSHSQHDAAGLHSYSARLITDQIEESHIIHQLQQQVLTLQTQLDMVLATSEDNLNNNIKDAAAENERAGAFMKVRKERAQTEILLQSQRERAINAEKRVTELEKELTALTKELKQQKTQYATDIASLQASLISEHSRQKYLKQLNAEAYELLELYSIKKI